VAAQHADRTSWLRRIQGEARVSYMTSPEYGRRVEAEGRLRAWLGQVLDAGFWLRFGMGDAQAPGALDAARADVNLHWGGWRISSGVRYTANTGLDVPIYPALVYGSRTLQTDVTASWQPAPWISTSLSGWALSDLGTGLSRDLVGPELAFPTLFGRVGGPSLGYLQEFGWMRGKSAYLQFLLRPTTWLRTWVRASYFEQQLAPTSFDPQRELGLYVNLDFPVVRWVAIRLSGLGRLPVAGPPGTLAAAGWVNAGLTGSF
jgi:hypothetical protein